MFFLITFYVFLERMACEFLQSIFPLSAAIFFREIEKKISATIGAS